MQRDALEGILDRETLIQALEKKFKLKKNEKNRILKTKNIENTIQKILQDHGASLNDSGNLKITNLDRLIFTKNGEFTI